MFVFFIVLLHYGAGIKTYRIKKRTVLVTALRNGSRLSLYSYICTLIKMLAVYKSITITGNDNGIYILCPIGMSVLLRDASIYL